MSLLYSRPGMLDQTQGAEIQPMWSPAQRARIEAEWHGLRRSFAFHPFVRVTPVAGEPPSEFEVKYSIQTLGSDSNGELTYLDHCVLFIAVPANFPHGPPVLRSAVSLFHPNATGDSIVLTPAWNPATTSLTDVVTRCGQLLAYQVLDPSAVVNPAAMDWVQHYSHLIPTDPNAILAPDADGEPLERILRAGGTALEEFRAKLLAMSAAILEDAPGTSAEAVARLGGEISQAIGLFFDPDIPQEMRDLGAELDAWARSMRAEKTVWDDLRALFSHLRKASAAIDDLEHANDSLRSTLEALEKLVTTGPADEPEQTLALLPDITALDPIAIRLAKAIRQADEGKARLAGALSAMATSTIAPVGSPGGLLHKWIGEQVVRGVLDAGALRDSSVDVLASIDRSLTRARIEHASLQHLATWAAFADLVRRGNQLSQRLTELGAAGIQACFVNGSGPYQFEEPLKAGEVLLVARQSGPATIEIFDARNLSLLGKGSRLVKLKLPQDTSVRTTEDANALRVLFDYLLQRGSHELSAINKATPPAYVDPATWAVKFSNALSQPNAVQTAAAVYQRASQRWMALYADLTELAQFKERLATHYLLERHCEFVPAILTANEKAKASLAAANEKLATIASKSSRDGETDQPLVPPQFVQENADALSKRTKAEKDLAKARRLLTKVTAELRARLTAPGALGRAGVPKLKLLVIESATADALSSRLTDDRINERVQKLEALLKTKLFSTGELA